MLTQIYNGKILTPEGWISGGSVVFEDSRISEVTRSHIIPQADKTVDARGMYVLPGGIELHCHGGGGSDFMEGTPEAFRTVAATHLRHGTTAIFATLSSASLSMMETACATCQELMREPGTTIMGLHLEGPYFNPRKAGAQMPDAIRTPDPAEYTHLVEDYDWCAVGTWLPSCRELWRWDATSPARA